MSTEEYSSDFFKGPAYALVIGISKYEYGTKGEELGPNEFPNLKLAAKDARDFATFLENNGFITYNVRQLFDEQAKLKNIRSEFNKLRSACRESGTENPLVIVYFSGHGWVDGEGRHYLIPYDAERSDLFASAFWNKDFNECLDMLETNRLVVFLDACHAGAMRMKDAKGALPQYNPTALGEGKGRYLIASCGPGQKSFEWEEKQNSIFTRHLLELLKGETEDIDEEEIDIFTLYPVLKAKVNATAKLIYKQEQEPISEIEGGTGIILAINKRVRDKRRLKDEETREQKSKFLEIVCPQIKASKSGPKASITIELRSYVDRGRGPKRYDDFYTVFDEQLEKWRERGVAYRFDEGCDLLIRAYQYADDSPSAPKETPLQEPPKPVDKFDSPPENKVWGVEKSKAPAVLPPSLDQQQPRRKLSREDRDHVLEEIKMGRYFSEWRTLDDSLSQPISEKEFDKRIFSIMESKKDDDDLKGIVDTIMGRFHERWLKAEEVKPKTLSSLMMEEGKLMLEDQSRQIKSESPLPPSEQRSAEDESAPTERTGVFISYSHQDKKWLTELQTMLTPLVRSGAIKLWDDTKIHPGALWKNEIKKALASTKVAVLLVSANFLASEFIANNELPPLLKAAEDEGVIVYWIYVSSCMYEATEIKHYQAAHDPTRPLDRMSKPDRQAVLSEVCARIETLIH